MRAVCGLRESCYLMRCVCVCTEGQETWLSEADRKQLHARVQRLHELAAELGRIEA
jgi:hypothetical protein